MKSICPKCGKEFENNTKRKFCSRKCANGHIVSQEQKLKTKISLRKHYANKKLLLYLNDSEINNSKIPYFKTCSRCGKDFMCYSRNRKNCDNCYCNKNMHYAVKNSSNMGGIREKGGKTKEYIIYINRLNEKMTLNKEEIQVAQYLDRLNLNWHRNWNGFCYIDLKGKKRKFYPDFYIEDYDLYVEYKGWIDKKNLHKMTNALENNNFKLKIIYSNDKRYKDLGINLDDIKTTTNNLLFD